jgi:HlyD family secretion protein
MKNKKKALIPVILLAGAAAGYLFVRGNGGPDKNRILLSGNIEMTEVNIGFKSAGQLQEIAVREGDHVQQGQVLARLDRDQLLQQKAAAEAALAGAEAQLAQAHAAAEWQRRTVSGDIQARQAELETHKARLAELREGSRPQEIKEAEAAATAARAEFERASRDWERAQTLYKDEDISTQQYDQFRARYESAAAALRQAEQRAALVREGPRKETIAAAEAQVARARAGLDVGEANRIEVRRREQEIAARKAEIERLRAQIALIGEQLADTIAQAPIAGVVLVKSADEGEIVAPGTTILTLGDTAHPWLRGYVNETDLGRVKLGQRVGVSTDSYPGKTYDGRVTFIASEAEFTPKQIQTTAERVKLVYRIKVEVANPHGELKLNMPADAEILLQ